MGGARGNGPQRVTLSLSKSLNSGALHGFELSQGSLATVKVNVLLVPTCQLSKGCCCCPRCECLEAVILCIAFPLDSRFVYYVCFF